MILHTLDLGGVAVFAVSGDHGRAVPIAAIAGVILYLLLQKFGLPRSGAKGVKL
jgi:hypothetical protein